MKTIRNKTGLLILVLLMPSLSTARVQVVTTLTDYAWAARAIAGDLAEVSSILPPEQDAHTLAPRPSYALKLSRADLFVATGLDLEIWVPALLRRAGNASVRPGAPGYVRAADGVPMLNVPTSADRSGGDVHVQGNPHIHTSPVNMRFVLRNISAGLGRVDPTNAGTYTASAERVIKDLDERLFGPELVAAMGGDLAARLAARGRLFDLLKEREWEGRPMSALLGGWLGRLQKAQGAPVASYHLNWAYLIRLTGLRLVTVAEPKPGLPPTPGHVARMLQTVQQESVKVLLAARHFPPDSVAAVCEKTGLTALRLPFHTGSEGVSSYPALVERWVQVLEQTLP